MSDETKIQQLVRRALDEGRSIDMGHLSERDRVLVCETIVDLIEAISPRLKTRSGCTANWHTCPAGAAHRKVTVCWAFAALAKQTGAATQSAVDRSRFFMASSLLLHHAFGAHVLQVHGDGVNDRLVQVLLAVFDDEMLEFAASP